MNRIIVEIDNEANTKLFISLMQNLKFVKSAITDKKDSIDDLKYENLFWKTGPEQQEKALLFVFQKAVNLFFQ